MTIAHTIVASQPNPVSQHLDLADISSTPCPEPPLPSADLIKRSVFGMAPMGSTLVIFGGEVDPSSLGHMGAGGFAGDTLALELTAPEKGFSPLPGLAPPMPCGR